MTKLHSHTVDNLSNRGRDITTVEALDLEAEGEETALPLVQLIEDLQATLASIPEEFRETAVLQINAYGDYACAYAHVYYKRPETDAEMAARIAWLNDIDIEQEHHERLQYERLVRKFGPPNGEAKPE